MFCPECGTLSFPDPYGNIKCSNYSCGYHGDAANKVLIGDEEVDLSIASSSSKADDRDRRTVDDITHLGGLTKGIYICPKCDCDEIYSEVDQIRAKPTTTLFQCKKCRHGWRED